MTQNNYTANDIETLSFRDAVRERVAMYMGSADNQGVLQCIREIITNSIDEATMGYGNIIIVELVNIKILIVFKIHTIIKLIIINIHVILRKIISKIIIINNIHLIIIKILPIQINI